MGFLLVIALFPLLVAEKLGTMNRERERGKLADFSVIFFLAGTIFWFPAKFYLRWQLM